MNESEYIVKFQYCWLTYIKNFKSAYEQRKKRFIADLWSSLCILLGNRFISLPLKHFKYLAGYLCNPQKKFK